jgi:hypothetical protein
MEISFDSFKDASVYAGTVAREKGASVRVVREANTWVVVVPEPETQSDMAEEGSPVQIDENTAELGVSPGPGPTSAISTEPSPLSPEDEWNKFLELSSKVLKGDGSTERDAIEEFTRLIRERNPFAVKAKERYDSKNPGGRASTAYEQARVHGITNLYQHGEDTRKPKEWPPDHLRPYLIQMLRDKFGGVK